VITIERKFAVTLTLWIIAGIGNSLGLATADALAIWCCGAVAYVLERNR